MEDFICLDTGILIELLRKNKETVDWIKEKEEECILSTTTINLFELYYGSYLKNRKDEMNVIEDLKSRLKILNLNEENIIEAAKQGARLQNEGFIIDKKDLLIGSITLKEGFKLKTNNKKHFEKIEGLSLI